MVVVSPSHSFEKTIKASISVDSPPHIIIDTEFMQVDSTNVTIDRTKDLFKDLGLAIIGNIVDYISSIDEEK